MGMMKNSLFAVLAMGCALSADGAERWEEAFERAATTEGNQVYTLACKRLVSHGKKAVPFLEEKAAAEKVSWQERFLARTALEQMQNPNRFVYWRNFLLHHEFGLKEREDGELVVVFGSKKRVERGKAMGIEEGMVVPKDALVTAVHILRMGAGSTVKHPREVLTRFVDPENLWALLELGGLIREEEIDGVTKRLPAEAVEVLHKSLLEPGQRGSSWYRTQGTFLALRKMGNAETARLMIAQLADPKQERFYEGMLQTLVEIAPKVDPEGLVALLEQKLLCREEYEDLREVFLAVGERVLPALKSLMADQEAPAHRRALATGIAFEIENPKRAAELYALHAPILRFYRSRSWAELPEEEKSRQRRWHWWSGGWGIRYAIDWPDVPAPFVLESAAALGRYEPVGALRGNALAAGLLEESITSGRITTDAASAAVALLGEEALPMLRRGWEVEGNQSEAIAILGALVRLGTESAAPVAELFARNTKLAPVVAKALREGGDSLRDLLKIEDKQLRLSVVIALLQRKDPAAIPAALEILLTFDADQRRDRWEYRRRGTIAKALVQMPAATIPSFKEATGNKKLLHVSVVVDEMILRITNPELSRKFDQAAWMTVVDNGHKLGPSVADYHGAGQMLATKVGSDAIPLLRGAVARGEARYGARPHPAVAAFALAALEDVEALPIIAKSANRMGSVRRGGFSRRGGAPIGSLAGSVLRAYGEKGIELAKTIPAPIPDREHFQERTARHRGASAALQGIDDDMALEKIIEGLKLAASGTIPESRAKTYLDLAIKHHDPRLIGPAAGTFKRYPKLAWSAGTALHKYKDPRVVPAALGLLKHDNDSALAWQGIGAVKGGESFAFVERALAEEKNEEAQAMLVISLAEFQPGGIVHHLAGEGMVGMTQKEVVSHLPKALDHLMAYTQSEFRRVREAAADKLVSIKKLDKTQEIAQALAQFVIDHERWPNSRIYDAIIASGNEDAMDDLEQCFRNNPDKRYRMAPYLVKAGRTGIAPVMLKTLDKWAAAERNDYTNYPLAHAIAACGKEERDALFAMARDHQKRGFTVSVLSALAAVDDNRGFEEGKKIFAALVKEPEAERKVVLNLAKALVKMDWKTAYPVIVEGLVQTKSTEIQRDLASLATRMEYEHPELK